MSNQNNNQFSSAPNEKSDYSNVQSQYKFSEPVRVEPVNLQTNVTSTQASANTAFNNNANRDAEWGNMNGLNDKNVRIGFIRKVYLIVSTQLLFTFGIVAIFVSVDAVKNFAKSDTGLYFYLASYITFVVLIIIFSFCQCTQGLRTYPYNYMLLFAITISLTYMLGMISSYHDIKAVFLAIGVTLFVSIGITVAMCQTKYDFTATCWLIGLCLILALTGFGISCAITYRYWPILQAVYGGIGATLMAVFLAVDTSLLIGKGRFAYSPEDYINAALQIYLDICYMFLYLLQFFYGGKK